MLSVNFLQKLFVTHLDARSCSLQAALYLETNHATELLHLSPGNSVSAVGRQSRVVDTQNLGVCFEVLGQTLGAV